MDLMLWCLPHCIMYKQRYLLSRRSGSLQILCWELPKKPHSVQTKKINTYYIFWPVSNTWVDHQPVSLIVELTIQSEF